MNDRRPLVDGLKTASPEQKAAEESFVYGGPRTTNDATKPRPIASAKGDPATPQDRAALLPQMYNRVPITTRARPHVASALKRASLERQLAGTEPFYVQDIMEVALETWLRDNGHLA
jgi:hypothetical protein